MEYHTVCVLMSTYNGEKFLEQQLRSIYDQRGVRTMLLVRDDNSSDSTTRILLHHSSEGRLEWYGGQNLGPARSYMDLLGRASGRAELYAFSDQDDVWLPEKLGAAASAIGSDDCPALYMCPTTLVDAELAMLPQKRITPRLTFGESLIYQYASGCTMVFNEALRRIVMSYEPRYLFMHDAWVVAVAFAVGAKVFYDHKSYIKYRQHGGNVIGEGGTMLSDWHRRLRRIRSNQHVRSCTATELLKGYGHIMKAENRSLVAHMAACRTSWRSRLWLVMSPQMRSSNGLINVSSRFAILTGRF